MQVDLHSHSIFSDGTKSPQELLDLARKIGLKAYAITDHDNIEGSKILTKLEHNDITIFSGIEMNAQVSKGQMHILGYNIDLENEKLNKYLKTLKEYSIINMKLYLEVLKNDFNITLPEEDLIKMFNNKGNIGRPELALILIKYGYVKDVSEAFTKYLTYASDKVRKDKKELTKEECIKLINNAGGVASLAHPWSLELTDEELRLEVAYLSSIGLRGIEVIHSNSTQEQRDYYHHLAKEFNLFETGGTDFHGKEVKPNIELGSGIKNNVNINLEDLSFLKDIHSIY